MTMKVLVGSMAQATVVEVDGSGLTPIEAKRNAVNIARGLHRIPDPIAIVDDHRSAKVYRAIAAQFAPKMPIERTTAFFRQPESRAAMYES